MSATPVARAQAASTAWRAAANAQRARRPDHTEFYDLAAEIVDTLTALDILAVTLARQVGNYADTTPASHRVYDDSRSESRDDTGGTDPRRRLCGAARDLRELRAALHTADRVANRFWSAISHIGTEPARKDLR